MQKSSLWQRSAPATRDRMFSGLLGLLILALVAAGCASTPPAQAPAAPAVQPAAAPVTSEPATPQVLPATGATPTVAASGAATGAASGGAALVNLAQKASFGLFLVDDKGMTLYEYTKDTPNTSTCYDQCAAAWPPLLTGGAPLAGTGITPSLLGTTARTDGKTQVTYSGHPLYYFAKDQKPGDINGQGVGGVWFVLSPRGGGMTSSKVPGTATPQAFSVIKPEPTPTGPATPKVSQNDQLGQFLVDDKGMTLYLYTKDTPNTSTCYDQCAVTWPPFYSNGAPVAGSGIDASLLGTTTRKDGTVQVTYKGWPLYYWFRDQKPGDTLGQWVGGTWFVISPKGEQITAGKPPATAAPAPTAASAAPAATTAPAAPAAGGYGNGAAATAAPSTAAGQTVSVAISNFAFAPKTLTVAPGTTVEWTNQDSAGHTVTADNSAFDSGNMNQGATFKFTFTQPGTYAYYCRYHGGPGGQGMAGQIIVE
jgi:predicted lipoprotein with Yx(FWY)xxD motif/plastocyanin